ncbi:Z1 domain-containing protein [Pelistega sp. NLN82]|uniref:Z1 domain-containing protein n=1 Tax=Pelistega ratti TaxID=2652177 RepID=A0A6L9Y656_9BURK|nr:Z1 domain-containing protein [Pelistega ratti]NEN75736.1 Z1 domain-containing protein [Pelistega ratti]
MNIEEKSILDAIVRYKTEQNNISNDNPFIQALLSTLNSDESRNRVIEKVNMLLTIKQDSALEIIEKDSQHKSWVYDIPEENFKYTKRYEDYLRKQSFPIEILKKMKETNRKILNYLGNPNAPESFKRKGLVVGQVQAGKTGNYISLINQAIDSGYKLIILIAGIHNNLRSQTQHRVNEGVIGYDWLSKKSVGVGVNSNLLRHVSLTTTESDFDKNSQTVIGFTPANVPSSVILVIKKNTNTLQNLKQWLEAGKVNNEILDYPVLMIDDEADNASINTAKNNATRINAQIRSILNLFKKVSYVGYTATPFANIFINPDTDDEMLKDDLFPEHFIFSLQTPSNYIGADAFFANVDNEGEEIISDNISIIDDYHDYIPIKMSKDYDITQLPNSLEKAIKEYLLLMVVKKLRNHRFKHSSMLINISPLTYQQKQVKKLIDKELNIIRNNIHYEGAKRINQAIQNPMIAEFKKIYDALIFNSKPDFPTVLEELVRIISSVQVMLINSSSEDRLNYNNYSEGLNVIAIGGYSLSRGLTLEGLIMSYIIRNTKTYDTLLQMGRWFGYREEYADLCRLYLPQEVYNWYSYVTLANQELQEEFRIMERNSLTPKDYGLRIRHSPEGMMVTAKNKMYNSDVICGSLSFSAKLVSPLRFTISGEIYENNKNEIFDFISKLQKDFSVKIEKEDGVLLWKALPYQLILSFLDNYRYTDNELIKKGELIDYINQGINLELAEWDVLLPLTGNGTKINTSFGISLEQQKRTLSSEKYSENIISFTDAGGRIARIWEEAYGLDEKDKEKADKQSQSTGIKQTSRWYREYRKRPLLILKLFEVYIGNEKKADMVPAFAISFPCEKGKSRLVKYQVNKIYLKNDFDEEDDEIEDDK